MTNRCLRKPVILDLFCCEGGASSGYAGAGFDVYGLDLSPQPRYIVGNFSGVDRGRRVMGMPWASRDGLREAIPPAYSEWVGRQLIQHLVATA